VTPFFIIKSFRPTAKSKGWIHQHRCETPPTPARAIRHKYRRIEMGSISTLRLTS
jgi:hypothetical protein